LISIHSEPRDSPPMKIPKLVQTDESSFAEASLNNDKVSQSIPIVEPPPTTPTSSSQHSNDELNWTCDSFKIRELIFEKIDKIVELRYQLLLPKLELMVKQAPTEIMRKLVRNNEIKSAFPDVVDIMFEWGIDKERRKNRADANEKGLYNLNFFKEILFLILFLIFQNQSHQFFHPPYLNKVNAIMK
jgi:hypothetical protein